MNIRVSVGRFELVEKNFPNDVAVGRAKAKPVSLVKSLDGMIGD